MVKRLLAEAEEIIFGKNTKKTISLLSECIRMDKEYSVEHLKQKGWLRHSAYLHRAGNPLPGLAGTLLWNQAIYHLTDEERIYFESLRNFKRYLPAFTLLYEKNSKAIGVLENTVSFEHKEKVYIKSKVKAILAINELIFMGPREPARDLQNLEKIEYYSSEEISEGISLIISAFNTQKGIRRLDYFSSDVDFMESNKAKEIVKDACRFVNLKDLEILMENFGFSCTPVNGKLIIAHPDEMYGKCYDLSNFIYQQQKKTDSYRTRKENSSYPSLEDLSKKYEELFPDSIEQKEEPFRRFIFKMPVSLITMLFKAEEFFLEELSLLLDLEKELLIPLSNLKKYVLFKGLTVEEMLRMHRFFKVQFMLIAPRYLKLLEDSNRSTVLASLMMLFETQELITILGEAISKEKAVLYLELLTWNAEPTSHLDLQYNPIIQKEGYSLISLSVLAQANIIRNVIISQRKKGNNIRQQQVEQQDVLPLLLTETFLKAGFITQTEIPIKHRTSLQKESDIDFLAFKDGVLFIFECKDSVHPAGPFELRTTYDYIQKAALQLQYILLALTDEAYRKKVCARVGIDPDQIRKIQPAIILSNRSFWGLNYHGYPVRYIKELQSLIKIGEVSFSLPDETELYVFKLWENERFSVNDLCNYCGEDSWHSILYKGMIEIQTDYGGGLYKKSYAVEMIRTLALLQEKYPYTIAQK